MLPYYLLLAAGIACGAAGQLALKGGSAGTTDHLAQFLHPLTIAGFGFYVLAAVLYIAAIKRIPISLAFPSVSISYAVVAYAAHLLWDEPFGAQQLLGLAMISGGILVLYR